MPPWNYRLLHWNAAPSPAEKDSVNAWIGRSLGLLASHGQYPFGLPDEAPEGDEEEEGHTQLSIYLYIAKCQGKVCAFFCSDYYPSYFRHIFDTVFSELRWRLDAV